MTFNIGIGFNLANSEPTLSFNDLLKKQGLSPLDPETYFAKFFNCLEKFLDMLETDDGKNNILQLYHQYWLHQGKLLKGIDQVWQLVRMQNKHCRNLKAMGIHLPHNIRILKIKLKKKKNFAS